MTDTREREADVVVIGGGPAGENAAAYAIADSARTAIIVEHELVGGECSYWACIPSKALLRPVAMRSAAQATPGMAPVVGDRPLDVSAIFARRDAMISHLDDAGQVEWARGAGIEVLRGHGRLDGERTVVVTGSDGEEMVVRARHAVVLATGATPKIPPIAGLAEARPWTSRDVTAMREVPERTVVVGGGVVACEAATWLRGLGSRVTMVVRGDRLLSGAEPFAGAAVAEALRDAAAGGEPVDIRFGATIEKVGPRTATGADVGELQGGPVTVRTSGSGGANELEADELVVATGRGPSATALGLDSVGLDPDAGLETDDHMRVEAAGGAWLYAVGDLAGRAPLTHMGKYEARVCGDVIAARAEGRPWDGPRFRASADHDQVPQVVFTDPQVAWVGRTEVQARAAGVDVEVLTTDLGATAGAALQRPDYAGQARLVVDQESDTVVGATFVGPEVGEMLHAATIAVVGAVPLDRLWHAVPVFPTVSEAWLRLLESRGGPSR